MIRFSTEEQNLICLYDPGSREGLMYELREMQKDLMPDEDDLEALTRSVLKKLESMTDDEYFDVVQALSPFYPLDEDPFTDDEPYLDEDSAYGWSDHTDYNDSDPDTEIE